MTRRCKWCGITPRWRFRWCKTCKRAALGGAGIYLQNGGPPFPKDSRLGMREHG